MSSISTTITFEHGKGNEPSNLDDGDLCEDEIEITLEYEPGESNYGADADGNRGISVPGYFTCDDKAPDKCTECGHIYSDEERIAIVALMNKTAEDYEHEPDEPDYDEDDYRDDVSNQYGQ